jgi:pimeloyl-ACP methyl ester carboxylesterase
MPRIDVGEIELHYERRGRGPALLLIPGLSLDTRLYEGVVPLLEQRFDCIAVDLRGAGLSEVPRGPYTIELLAGDLFGLLAGLGIDRALIAGHSMGGHVALQLALDNRELVAGLALLGTSATGRPELLGSSPAAAAALGRTQGSIEEIVRGNIEVSLGRRFLREQRAVAEAFIATRVAHPPRGRGVAGQRAAARSFDVRDRLAELGCPCTILHGDDDQVVPLARGEELAAGIPAARLFVLDGVGHLPQLEAPTVLAAALIDLGERARRGRPA